MLFRSRITSHLSNHTVKYSIAITKEGTTIIGKDFKGRKEAIIIRGKRNWMKSSNRKRRTLSCKKLGVKQGQSNLLIKVHC